MQDSAYTFHKNSIKSFGNTIMLWHVMGGKLAFCPTAIQVMREFIRQILPPIVE